VQPTFDPCAESAGSGQRGDLQSTLAALTSVAALRAAVLQWYETDRQGSLLDLVDHAFDLLENGAAAVPTKAVAVPTKAAAVPTKGARCPHR